MGLGNSMQIWSKIGTFLAFKHPNCYFNITVATYFISTHMWEHKRSNIDRLGVYETLHMGISQ